MLISGINKNSYSQKLIITVA